MLTSLGVRQGHWGRSPGGRHYYIFTYTTNSFGTPFPRSQHVVQNGGVSDHVARPIEAGTLGVATESPRPSSDKLLCLLLKPKLFLTRDVAHGRNVPQGFYNHGIFQVICCNPHIVPEYTEMRVAHIYILVAP